MQNEVIKTALLHPHTIQDVISSGLVDGRALQKLQEMSQHYLANKQLPSKSILEKIFNISLDEENPSDRDVVYQLLHEFNVEKYLNAVQDRLYSSAEVLSLDEIRKLEKKYIKEYGEKAETKTTLTCPQDVISLSDKHTQRAQSAIASGYTCINNLTKDGNSEGGWRPGSMYCVMGLSGYGKTIVLSNFARDAWEKNHNVLFISTEMNDIQVYERILKSHYQVKTFDEVKLCCQKSPFPKGIIEVIKVHPNDTSTIDVQEYIDRLD
jgi:replicative DNA helicase